MQNESTSSSSLLPLASPTSTTTTQSPQSKNLLSTLLKRTRYYIPILKWLSEYKPSSLLYDLLAGFSISLILIPQSLSYSQHLVHVPAIFGLYNVMISCLVYCVFGTSRVLSVGPEAMISLLSGLAFKESESNFFIFTLSRRLTGV